MPNPAPDHDAARALMVDGQVRPNKVNDPRIIAAMRALPRERFVPASRIALAYSDEDVPLGGGRYLVEPMVIGRMVQILAPRAGERVLVVGAGTGYGAALLAACGAAVTALEEDEALLAIARGVLPAVAPGILLAQGPLADGWKAAAPYDAILIEGAVQAIPEALPGQLRAEGRLVAVLKPGARMGQAVLASATGGGPLAPQPVFDCATPLLPTLQRAPGFVF